MLEPLGISPDAEALYTVLAPLDDASADELANKTDRPLAELQRDLADLADLGLAYVGSGNRWKALPLVDVVKGLKAARLAELDQAAIAAQNLQNQLLAASQSDGGDIQVFVGWETAAAEYKRQCSLVTNEVCAFDKPPYVSGPMQTPDDLRKSSPEWQALERGVVFRSVYHPGFDQDRLKEMALFATVGEQSRTAPVPMKLVLFDGHTACVPSMASFSSGHETRVGFVRHPLLVESLVWLFNTVWDTAIPVSAAGYINGAEPRRQMLIAMMMSGSTDDAIANQLGVNVRSVRRWIAELMDELGVTTRLQLGAALVRAANLHLYDGSRLT